MTDERLELDPAKARRQLLSGNGTVPALHPPRDWKQVEHDAVEEFALRNTLSGLPEESAAYKRFSALLTRLLAEAPGTGMSGTGDSAPDPIAR